MHARRVFPRMSQAWRRSAAADHGLVPTGHASGPFLTLTTRMGVRLAEADLMAVRDLILPALAALRTALVAPCPISSSVAIGRDLKRDLDQPDADMLAERDADPAA